jgi:hypothetical protein
MAFDRQLEQELTVLAVFQGSLLHVLRRYGERGKSLGGGIGGRRSLPGISHGRAYAQIPVLMGAAC